MKIHSSFVCFDRPVCVFVIVITDRALALTNHIIL